MMFVVIFANLLGSTVQATMQGIVSSAADARHQGQTMGAMTGLSSLMAVIGPALAALLFGAVSHLPRADWRLGLPLFFGAALLALAWALAFTHFRRRALAAAPLPCSTTRS
jgi:DHA1 family tetracycline resistance protein-like MFS transporter